MKFDAINFDEASNFIGNIQNPSIFRLDVECFDVFPPPKLPIFTSLAVNIHRFGDI